MAWPSSRAGAKISSHRGRAEMVPTAVQPDPEGPSGDRPRDADASEPHLRNQVEVLRVVAPLWMTWYARAAITLVTMTSSSIDHPLLRILASAARLEGAEQTGDQHGDGNDDPVPVDLERSEPERDGVDHRGRFYPGAAERSPATSGSARSGSGKRSTRRSTGKTKIRDPHRHRQRGRATDQHRRRPRPTRPRSRRTRTRPARSDAPMKTAFTALTRPRIASGVCQLHQQVPHVHADLCPRRPARPARPAMEVQIRQHPEHHDYDRPKASTPPNSQRPTPVRMGCHASAGTRPSPRQPPARPAAAPGRSDARGSTSEAMAGSRAVAPPNSTANRSSDMEPRKTIPDASGRSARRRGGRRSREAHEPRRHALRRGARGREPSRERAVP